MTVGPVDPGVKIAVSKATVELRGFHHSAPRDVDVLLVAPNGRQVLLMSDAGGAGAVSSRNYLFDDAAAAGLSTTANSASGTYKPTNVGTTTDAFPAPAPAPFGAAYPTTLGGLAGTDPQGAWRLYVQDDLNGSDDTSGAISNGWRLNLTLVDATPIPATTPATWAAAVAATTRPTRTARASTARCRPAPTRPSRTAASRSRST